MCKQGFRNTLSFQEYTIPSRTAHACASRSFSLSPLPWMRTHELLSHECRIDTDAFSLAGRQNMHLGQAGIGIEAERATFYCCATCQRWLVGWLMIFNNSQKLLKQAGYFASSKMQLLQQVLTPATWRVQVLLFQAESLPFWGSSDPRFPQLCGCVHTSPSHAGAQWSWDLLLGLNCGKGETAIIHLTWTI